VRNTELADHLGISGMTLHRWREKYPDFPEPSIVAGLPLTSFDEVDAWMKLQRGKPQKNGFGNWKQKIGKAS